MNRPESPCDGDGNSEAKEVRDNTVKGYLHGIGGDMECQNVNDIPCMIPQAKDLLTSDEQKSLNQCSTLLQYNCMFQTMWSSAKHAQKSVKKCTTSSVSVGYDTYDDASAVRKSTIIALRCIQILIFMYSGWHECYNNAYDLPHGPYN